MADTVESILKDLFKTLADYQTNLTEGCRDLRGYQRTLQRRGAIDVTTDDKKDLRAESSWRAAESAGVKLALGMLEPWIAHYGPELEQFRRRFAEVRAAAKRPSPPVSKTSRRRTSRK